MTEKPFTGATVNTDDGRIFKWLEFKPYTRKDGTGTELSIWGSTCAICGALFTVATPKAGDSKAFGRKHCDAHKLTQQENAAQWGKRMAGAKTAKRGAL
jgi:hypothetical protein